MPPERKTLYFMNLENDELCYLSYEFGSPWDYGRKVDIKFSLNNSNNALIYENVVTIDPERKEKDLERAIRFFLLLYRDKTPRLTSRGEHFLGIKNRDKYQFPGIIDDTILTVRVLEALESFVSYHPVEGLSDIDLMISLNVDRKPLERAINRLTARGIVKLTRMGPRYAIADHDKADDYKVKLMGELPDPPQQLLERQRRIGFARNNLK